MSSQLPTIEVSSQPIELCKLLKIANMVSGGGEAKIVISEGYVSLNGAVEFQKRKKVYHHDLIEFNGETIQVIVNEQLVKESLFEKTLVDKELLQTTVNKVQNVKGVNNKKNKQAKKGNRPHPEQTDELTPTQHHEKPKRRPISF